MDAKWAQGGRKSGVGVAVVASVRGPKGPEPRVEIAQNPRSRDADRIAASKELLDRGWGRAPTVAPIEGYDPLEMDELTAEIRSIAADIRGDSRPSATVDVNRAA